MTQLTPESQGRAIRLQARELRVRRPQLMIQSRETLEFQIVGSNTTEAGSLKKVEPDELGDNVQSVKTRGPSSTTSAAAYQKSRQTKRAFVA